MSKFESYTVKDTGATFQIRKVSPLLLLKLRDKFPPPVPPQQEVDYGDGVKRLEANPAHPEYVKAQADYDQMMELKARELMVRRGVIIDWTEERQAEYQEFADWWQATYDEPLDGDRNFNYIYYIAIGSDSDLEELITALVRRSQPTEEAVKAATARFQGPA